MMKLAASPPIRLFLVLLSFAVLSAACVRRQRTRALSTPIPASAQETADKAPITPRININTASAKALEQLPGIGPGLAQRIVEHREKYGPFRRPEHLIMVRGFGDRRVRVLRDMIMVE